MNKMNPILGSEPLSLGTGATDTSSIDEGRVVKIAGVARDNKRGKFDVTHFRW